MCEQHSAQFYRKVHLANKNRKFSSFHIILNRLFSNFRKKFGSLVNSDDSEQFEMVINKFNRIYCNTDWVRAVESKLVSISTEFRNNEPIDIYNTNTNCDSQYIIENIV